MQYFLVFLQDDEFSTAVATKNTHGLLRVSTLIPIETYLVLSLTRYIWTGKYDVTTVRPHFIGFHLVFDPSFHGHTQFKHKVSSWCYAVRIEPFGSWR